MSTSRPSAPRALIALGLTGLAAVVIAAPGISTAAGEKPQNVVVINDANTPVPVTPTGTAAVEVRNTPTVEIANMPTVQLAESAPTDPFSVQGSLDIGDNSNTILGFDEATLLNVPAGKIAVIDFVSAFVETDADAIPALKVVAENGASRSGAHYIELNYAETMSSQYVFDRRVYFASHPLSIIAQPGDEVSVSAYLHHYPTNAVTSADVLLSGHYVAAP